ncbi:hypothetical protein [Aquimarina macrocephali]|uniref:hypothetical protein n=1 Tax=Aquimarina macrocephali TaxID=666563 RepID=UPI0004632F4F|nr:hypothetical protein [Aquimarina macrocephali]
MKNKIKFNLVRIIVIFTLFLCYSCSSEEDTIHKNEESIEIPVLTPKTLVTIELPSNTTITFKTETDGIVFEASGDSDNFGELDGLDDLSLLDRFLTLTDESIAVPTDLIKLEEDQKIKEKALQRATIEKHSVNLSVAKSFLNNARKDWLDHCGDPKVNNNFTGNDHYKQTYINYNTIVTTSSLGKSGYNGKCRKVQYSVSNCSYTNSLYVSYYNYPKTGPKKLYSLVNIPKRKHKYYSKTYFTSSKKEVQIAGAQNKRFVGYVIFSKYKNSSVGGLGL